MPGGSNSFAHHKNGNVGACLAGVSQPKVYTVDMNEINLPPARNVFKEPLVPCSFNPVTGFFRDGCCRTNEEDVGTHVVCVVMTDDFLEFSRSRGNDLSTPIPEWGFPGLKPGDQWCLCALRWVEAFQANAAPSVVLESTNFHALDLIDLEVLQRFDHRHREID